MKCKVIVIFVYIFIFDFYIWIRSVMVDFDSRFWWVECLIYWGLKWVVKVKISFIMFFNLFFIIFENDI